MVDLIRDDLATGRTEHLVIAGHKTEIMRVRITDAGREAEEDWDGMKGTDDGSD